jgi:hypothetical protein
VRTVVIRHVVTIVSVSHRPLRRHHRHRQRRREDPATTTVTLKRRLWG